MIDRAIASDLSYLVRQKIRRDLQGVSAPSHQARQGLYPRATCFEFLPTEDTGDASNSHPASVAVGEREQ